MSELKDWQTFFLELAEKFGLPQQVAAAITFIIIVAGWLTLPIAAARFFGRALGAVDRASRVRVTQRRHAGAILILSCIELLVAVVGILKICSVIGVWVGDSFPTGGTAPFVALRYLPRLFQWSSGDGWIGVAAGGLSALVLAFLLARLGAPRGATALRALVGYPLGWALEGLPYLVGITIAVEAIMAFAHLDGASPEVIPLLLALMGLGMLGYRALDPIDKGIGPAVAGRRVISGP